MKELIAFLKDLPFTHHVEFSPTYSGQEISITYWIRGDNGRILTTSRFLSLRSLEQEKADLLIMKTLKDMKKFMKKNVP